MRNYHFNLFAHEILSIRVSTYFSYFLISRYLAILHTRSAPLPLLSASLPGVVRSSTACYLDEDTIRPLALFFQTHCFLLLLTAE